MPSIEASDKLKESFRNFRKYPENLVDYKTSYPSVIEYQRRLEESKDVLFSGNSRPMDFIESWDGDQDPQEMKVVDLAKHTNSNRKDPKSRYISITAGNSPRPLSCSVEQLRQVLTYHQVTPSFLDAVFTFGPRSAPGSLYGQEDMLLEAPDQRFEVKSLGRSGSTLQHSFLLRVAENPRPDDQERWPIRNAAVYHSFDIATGRSVFITVADNTLSERLRGMLLFSTSLFTGGLNSGPTPTSIATSFGATLSTHLEIFRWCDESWRDYIQNLERALENLRDSRPGPTNSDPGHLSLPYRHTEPRDPSIEELEHIAKRIDCLEECLLVMKQNELAMVSVVTHYNDLLNMREVLNAMNGECCAQIARFFEQTSIIKTNLQSYQLRLETLKRVAQSRREMIQGSLAFQSMASKMGKVSERTLQETAQMHIITIVTLIFLPGTFVATLLGRISSNNSTGSPPPSQTCPPVTSQTTFDNWKVLLSLAAGIGTVMILAVCVLRNMGTKPSNSTGSTVEGHHRRYESEKDQFELPLSTSR